MWLWRRLYIICKLKPVSSWFHSFHLRCASDVQIQLQSFRTMIKWPGWVWHTLCNSVLCKPQCPAISPATSESSPGYFLAESRFFIRKLLWLSVCLQHSESLGLICFVSISSCQFGSRIEYGLVHPSLYMSLVATQQFLYKCFLVLLQLLNAWRWEFRSYIT